MAQDERRALASEIAAFSRECEDDQYTDTSRAWELLEKSKTLLRRAPVPKLNAVNAARRALVKTFDGDSNDAEHEAALELLGALDAALGEVR